MKDLLTQEQKDEIINLHWNYGSFEEHDYYKMLAKENEEIKKIYDESIEEVLNLYATQIPKEEYYNGNYEWDYNEFDEFELNLMATLDEKLNVGVYE